MSKSFRSLFLFVVLAGSLVLGPVTSVRALSFPAEINKSFTPIVIVAGEISRLDINIYNPNLFQLDNASFTDSLIGRQPGLRLANPVNLVNSCGGLVVAIPGTTTISLSGGTVPAKVGGVNGSCAVSVDVTSTTAGNLINTIPAYNVPPAYGGVGLHATARGGLDTITNTTPASATLQVNGVQPPSVNKNFNPTTVWVGQSSQLEINIFNNDLNIALTEAALTDTLPVPFVVASPLTTSLSGCGAGTLTAAVGAASVTLNNATIAPNSNCRVRVRVVSSTQGQYTNTIPQGPGGPGSLQTRQGVTNTSPVTANINVQAVGVTKTFNPATIQQGDTSLLTITLRNPTGADYTGVGLVDNLPSGLTVSGIPASPQCGGTINFTADSITLVNGTIPSGNITTPGLCTIIAQVTSSTAGTYTNTIPANTMTGPITNAFPATANVTVQSRTIGVVKAFSGNFVQGGTTTLTITLQNRTSSTFTGVAFTDTMPANLTIAGTPTASASCGGGAIVTSTPNSVSLSNGVIPPGTVAVPGTCVITATVTSTTSGAYTNTIPANDVTSAQGIGNNSPSNNANVTVYAIGGPATVSKAFQTNPVLAGAPTRLRITITAPNDTSLSAIQISDTLPDDLLIVGTPLAPANPTTTCGGTLTAGIATKLIQLTGGAIAAAGGNCTITVYVTSNTPGVHTNTIPGNTLATFEGRTDPNNRSANLTVTNLSTSKSFTPGTISVNGLSRLTISLQNSNLLPLVNVSLTDLLTSMGGDASNGVFVAPVPNESTTCGGGTVTAVAGSQTISMANGTIPASDGVVPGLCTVSVDVQGLGATGTRTNTLPASNVIGTIQGTATTMRPPANVTAQLTISTLSINVVKGFDPTLVANGASSLLSIQLVNPNTAPLSGIAFDDTMPAGMILANPVNLDVGTCGGALSGTPGAGTFSFSGGSLPASGTCTMTLRATMTVTGNLTNTIPIGAVTTFEGATNPDAASASLTNLPGAAISKSFAPNPIPAGDVSLLTITITNTGGVDLTGMGLNDELPGYGTPSTDLVIAVAPAPVNNCGGSLTAAAGSQIITLTNGSLADAASCTIVVPVTSTVPNSYLNTIPEDALTNDQSATNDLPATDTLVVTSFSLGNRVWDDNGAGGGTANDGIRNGSEPGLNGVAVNLYLDSDNNGTPDGASIASTATDANGYYRFDNLAADTYIVEVIPPAGYISSSVNAGDPDTDVDDNDDNGVVISGGNILSNPVTLGPGASEPTGETDPVANPEAGETVDNQSNRTVDFGFYQPYSLGNRVWDDNGAGVGGVANDGIRNGSEPGISGVIVYLYRDSNDDGTPNGASIAFTSTDANGYYRFDNLTADTYIVEVVTPTGYASSIVNAGDPDTDVDDDDDNGVVPAGSNIRSNPVTLGPGASEPTNDDDPTVGPEAGEAPDDQSNRTVDFGFTAAYSLGNRVWFDNGAGGGAADNGIRDGTEPGIDGVTVNLYRDSNDDGTADGASIASTITVGGGYYRFDSLTADTYIVEVAIPTGYASSAVNAGDPDTDVDDNDDNGVVVFGGNIRSDPVTLGPGASEPTGETDPAANPSAGEAADNYSNRTVDFGFYFPPYSLGNRVWNDNGAGGGTANDGLRNGTEPGLSGVTVRLYRDSNDNGIPDGAAIAVTTTDINGYYRFDYLMADTYIVEAATPTGYMSSAVDAGDPDVDSDDDDDNGVVVSGSNMRSNPVTLGPGASEPTGETDPAANPEAGEAADDYSNRTIDFGFTLLASLGNFVWNDLDQDGIQDGGETGIPGVGVDLYRPGYGPDGIPGNGDDADIVRTTTTAGGGLYSFSSLIPGDYYVDFTPPAGYTISPIDQGADDAVDSDANTATGQTATTTLSPGENDLTWDAGMYQPPASLGNFVWNDLNRDGIQDGGLETGINGVRVDLYRPGYGPDGIPFTADDSNVVATTSTANVAGVDGIYNFTGLIPGDYYVIFTPPAGYAISPIDQGADDTVDSDANTATGQAATTTLSPGENDLTWDAGLYQLASLGNFVWDDLNRNGIQDGGLEIGVNGVTVELYTGAGTLVATTTTTTVVGVAGTYNFTNLIPGDYYVVFSPPAGYAISPIDQGADNTVDSDANTVTGQAATTTLTSGENDPTWDAGLYQLASLGNFVWSDLNRDGIQDGGLETGINGVTVDLYTGAGTFVATTTTATVASVAGTYSFTSLIPGNYYVVFTPPAGYTISPIDQGADDTVDSDANTATGQTVTTTLSPGENDLTWDVGMYQPPASLGNFVWNDLNRNGVQDSGENGINGVPVDLYRPGYGPDGIPGNADDANVVATTSTANVAGVDGIYSFINLIPGYYYVIFAPPAGYVVTLLDQGGDTLDSDAIVPTSQTIVTELIPGENDLTWDAGLYQRYSLGNRVWFDTNNNSQIDGGEAGVNGVVVNLYSASDLGTVIATDTTSGGGYYLFDDLYEGNYVVVIPSSNFTGGGALVGYRSSGTTRSNDGSLAEAAAPDADTDASDTDDNGTLQSSGVFTGAVVADVVTIGPGGVEPVGETDLEGGVGQGQLDAYANMTVDFGFYTIQLGNLVWNDVNNSGVVDLGDSGLPNVDVQLWSQDASVLLATVTTDGSGAYGFTGLPQGNYILRIPAVEFNPGGTLRDYVSSTGGVGTPYEPAPSAETNTADSDDNGSVANGTLGLGGYVQSSVFALTPAAEESVDNNLGLTRESRVDFGLYAFAQTDLAVTKDDGMTYYIPGGTRTYTVTVTNNGPSDATGAIVSDALPAQISSWTWACTGSTGGATGCDGAAGLAGAFSDTVNLPQGASISYTVTATISGSASGVLTNSVTVAPPVGVSEINSSNNTADDVDQPASLQVTKDDGLTIVGAGSTITYQIVVTNNGTVDLTSITVTDTLPADLTYQSALPAPASVAGPVITWDGLSLTAGSNTTITLTASVVNAPLGASITNDVDVVDTNTGANDSDDDVDSLASNSDFTKTLVDTNHSPTTDPAVAIGEIITYDLVLSVPAGSMANALVVDTPQAGLAFVDLISLTVSNPDIDAAGGADTGLYSSVMAFDGITGQCTNCADGSGAGSNPLVENNGGKVTFDLGTFTNSTAEPETVTIRYSLIALDITANQNNGTLANSASWTWTGGNLQAASPVVNIVEPDLSIGKGADTTEAPLGASITFTLDVAHTTNSSAHAYDVVVTDVLPNGLAFIPGTVSFAGLAPTSNNYDPATFTLTFTWDEFPLGQTSTITFQATFVGPSPVENSASVYWTSLPIDPVLNLPVVQSPYNGNSTERWYDPLDSTGLNNYGTQASISITAPRLPETGFAPGVITNLPLQPDWLSYTDLGDFWIEIPQLGIKLPIVGVPLNGQGWNLTWLGEQAGWLEGTAYPTHAGNSVITAHVFDAEGEAGPFVDLNKLYWGQKVIVHLGGQKYIYEVRDTRIIWPNDRKVFRHEEYSWLTLLTCKDYDKATGTYAKRVAVRAVLVKVEDE